MKINFLKGEYTFDKEKEDTGDFIMNGCLAILFSMVYCLIIVLAQVMGKCLYTLFLDWRKKNIEHNDKQDECKIVTQAPIDTPLSKLARSSDMSVFDNKQLIGKILYKGDKAIIYGERGTGKSVFLIQIAMDICMGKSSLIMPEDNGVHTPEEVLYYDGEMDNDDYSRKLGNKDMSRYEHFHLIREFNFSTVDEWICDIESRLNGVSGDATIVLDNISCVCSSINAEVIRNLFLSRLTTMRSKYQIEKNGDLTFIIVAHTNKESQLSGTMNVQNFATTIIRLDSIDKYHKISMTIEKNRKYGEMQNRTFLLKGGEDEDGWEHFEYVREIVPDNNSQEEYTPKKLYEMSLETNPETGKVFTQTEIGKKAGLKRETVNRKIKEYKEENGIK